MVDDQDVRILEGDALEQLATLPDESVHCIVTSPPFWALRDYGHDGQIGLEATPEEWCARLVDAFRECRRVLRSDGVFWLEVGDTYASSTAGGDTRGGFNSRYFGTGEPGKNEVSRAEVPTRPKIADGIKTKDLVGAPWMLAFALRADGWYLRSDTIWSRPNPMPESVTDRPTKAHSYVFLLTKSARYFYDADAIREPLSAVSLSQIRTAERSGVRDDDRAKGYEGRGDGDELLRRAGAGSRGSSMNPAGSNARSVWSIATEPTPFAHFATFPQALVERCIKAGTSEHGCCAQCGSPWRRLVETSGGTIGEGWHDHSNDGIGQAQTKHGSVSWATYRREHIGWEPTCSCGCGVVDPCTVLDPFMGSGTTALVARRLGRHAVGVELNPEYVAIAAKRLQQLSLLG